MKPIVLPLLLVTLCETGCAMVVLNASPHAPLSFWLWFGDLAVLSPLAGYRLYRWLIAAKA